ncbi:G-protein coupled receptor 52-like [Ptychodera flava]|uniref:G-protein coupled receptor 52-like n=1 Tax=Ptychodera flava TaxID=63121 RepID=UPI00396A09F1
MVGEQKTGLAVVVTETTLFAVIAFLIISSNVLNIAVLSKNNILSIGGRCFMMSLAVADLGVGLLFGTALVGCVTREALIDSVFPGCFVLGALNHIVYTASTISLALIALDRYLAISRPIYYLNVVTKTRAFMVTLIAWTLLALYAIALGLIDGNFYKYNRNNFLCLPIYRKLNLWLSTCIVLWLVPFGGIVFAYVRILMIIRNRRRRISNQVAGHEQGGNQIGSSATNQSGTKAAKMCIVITLVFFLAWLPYGVLIFYNHTHAEAINQGASPSIIIAVTCVLASNSFWNFVIYSAMNSSFRKAAFGLIKKLPCCSKDTPVENIAINTIASATEL